MMEDENPRRKANIEAKDKYVRNEKLTRFSSFQIELGNFFDEYKFKKIFFIMMDK